MLIDYYVANRSLLSLANFKDETIHSNTVFSRKYETLPRISYSFVSEGVMFTIFHQGAGKTAAAKLTLLAVLLLAGQPQCCH